MEPPIPVSTSANMSQDTFVNGVFFKKETQFQITIPALHIDPDQWKEPEKFVPDRFDPSSDWYKRPNGQNRNPLTFNPFLGGKRVCLGKTFAEITVKFTVPLLYHFFDFQFVTESDLVEKPVIWVTGRVQHKMLVKLINKHLA